jgi:NhaP-type Na+/H+ or K+/H+ antiporter
MGVAHECIACQVPAPTVAPSVSWFSIDPYEAALAFAGLVALVAATVPHYLRDRPLSVSIVLVLVGVAVFALPIGVPLGNPLEHLEVVERSTELGVIVALMGSGLSIDRRIGWRRWASTWRLLAVALPLSVALAAVVAMVLLGLPPAAALLLGAVLAPTDPVLAADVQVGEPNRGSGGEAAVVDGDDEDEVRFALTSEAGLNDGLAFPFVYGAIALAASGGVWTIGGVGRWLTVDLALRVVLGVVVGAIVGRVLGRLFFDPPLGLTALAEAAGGFVALAATFLAYGATELVRGYGFLAVFVAALMIRSAERTHEYHHVLHDFATQVEQVIVVALLVLLGGVVVRGGLDALDPAAFAVAAVIILVVRPLAGGISLAGGPGSPAERRTIAVFGIRGVGSFYYLAYALTSEDFGDAEQLWAVVLAAVLVSITVHGVAASPVMRRLDGRRRRAKMRVWASGDGV